MNCRLLTVLLLSGLVACLPAGRAADKPPPPAASAPAPPVSVPDAKLRGTVTALDFRRGAFTLRVNDHPWTIYVTPDTDVKALGAVVADKFPVTLGQRISLGGPVQPDGSVLAVLLTPSRDINYTSGPDQPTRILFGHISSRSDRLRGRDIKIRSADGLETKIKVGHGIVIRRAGRSISVHDLNGDDDIRVVGTRDGTDIKAARIDVLTPLPVPPLPADTERSQVGDSKPPAEKKPEAAKRSRPGL